MASLDVQTGEAKRYVAAEGGTLVPDVFLDDAVSRAEFKKRKGLIALLNAAKAKQIDAVVLRDESRLGGDTFRAGLVIQDLLESGVRLFYYYTDEEVTLDGAVDKFMIAARSFAAELEREKTAQRTHEHLLHKARKGLVVGGRVYGYDNIEIKDGDRRVRVEYRINPNEAEIVREIFRRYAGGEGLRTIAKDLDTRGVPAPRAGRRGIGRWSYSSIHEMLRRDRYRGVVVWGKHEKTYRGGTKVRVERRPEDWVTIEVPELRIVDDELWTAVQTLTTKHKAVSGAKTRGPAVRYLLSGLGRCSECGGPIHVANRKDSYDNVAAYACSRRKNQGPAACGNALRRPVADIDEVVLGWIRANVLTEELVADTLKEVRRRLSEHAQTTHTEVPELEAQVRTVKAELDRLGAALLATDDKPETVLRMISEREKRLAALNARLAAIRTSPSVLDLEVRRLEREARTRLDNMRALFVATPEKARRVLQTLLARPLTFRPVDLPEGKRYRIEGQVARDWIYLTEGVPSGVNTVVQSSKRYPPAILHGFRLPRMMRAMG
ncbi:recombinase family protein [Polyangium aurulentum]|nr:recombinase family protein [Polyangium aurulentum]